MSALSKSKIVSRLVGKDLVVSPVLSPEQMGPSSIDLRMGTVVLVARAGAQSHVDPSAYRSETKEPDDHDFIKDRKQKHERFDIPYLETYLLHPGSLALVPTLEWLALPLDLQGLVTARSSWAREGLNIATATIVNPGYRGIITLELANFGEIPIKLYPGLRLAQIAFYNLTPEETEPAEDSQEKMDESQFNMSFEPKAAAELARHDWPFIPNPKKNS